jgi:hypothetical protein
LEIYISLFAGNCAENEDPVKSLVKTKTFPILPTWQDINPGRKLAANTQTNRPLTAYHNRNSFMPHCAFHALTGGVQGQMLWPIRWIETGFVVSGFYKAFNGSKTEGNVLVVDFFRTFKTGRTPIFSIGEYTVYIVQTYTTSSHLVFDSTAIIFKELGREVNQYLDIASTDVRNTHLFSIDYR